jgi:type III restriction enzyme
METYWVPGVNNLGAYGRWAFAELTDMYEIESAFASMIEKHLEHAADLSLRA